MMWEAESQGQASVCVCGLCTQVRSTGQTKQPGSLAENNHGLSGEEICLLPEQEVHMQAAA